MATTTTTTTARPLAAAFVNFFLFSNIIIIITTTTTRTTTTVVDAASPIIFEDVQESDVIFTDSVLFDTDRAYSVVDCARMCYDRRRCQTFTFTQRTPATSAGGGRRGAAKGTAVSCRGYSWLIKHLRHSRPSLGSRTFAYSYEHADLIVYPDPCDAGGHGLLWQEARDEQDYGGSLTNKDHTLPAGWYRFLNGFTGDRVMSDTCRPKSNFCGSLHPMWLDLQGRPLPEVGGSVQARACGGGDGAADCCLSPRAVTVRRCPSFFIYYLVATADERFNYCSKS